MVVVRWVARRSCPSVSRNHESRDSLVDFHTGEEVPQPHRVDRVDGRVLDSVIYGEDDRREVYEEANPRVLEAWSATGALVDSAAIEADGDGS